ncbi:MAG: anhydro-N-acetylmuramic acid kinase [Bacteroidetes bacterium]|nr:anhydro-N-acetylmuramic acid kinase [Bacteroidota bacterium]
MVYHVIGTMSGSSMDGLDIAFCTFEEIGGKWSFHINHASCISFDDFWLHQLQRLTTMPAKELLLTHTAFGKWMGDKIQQFIEENQLQHKVHFIASHGHTVFHEPAQSMTYQIGDGAHIAAITQLPVITDLRNMDIALGGQGAPIVPIAESKLWNDHNYFLNIGGIANITIKTENQSIIAFDVCPANSVLNLLAQQIGQPYDKSGNFAASGNLSGPLLESLNALDYYRQSPPKSLANEFGKQQVFQIIQSFEIPIHDKLHTLCIHIAQQIKNSLHTYPAGKLLITGGGAFNSFLVNTIRQHLQANQIFIELPDADIIQYKEAVAMAFIGILRWREEENVLASVSGASRNSVGGAIWMGQM